MAPNPEHGPHRNPTTGSHQLQPHDLLSHLFNRSSFRKRASLASSPPPPPRSASFSETTIRSDLLPEYFPTRDSGPAGNYCRISHLPLADIFIRLAITKKPSLPFSFPSATSHATNNKTRYACPCPATGDLNGAANYRTVPSRLIRIELLEKSLKARPIIYTPSPYVSSPHSLSFGPGACVRDTKKRPL